MTDHIGPHHSIQHLRIILEQFYEGVKPPHNRTRLPLTAAKATTCRTVPTVPWQLRVTLSYVVRKIGPVTMTYPKRTVQYFLLVPFYL